MYITGRYYLIKKLNESLRKIFEAILHDVAVHNVTGCSENTIFPFENRRLFIYFFKPSFRPHREYEDEKVI